MMWEILLWTFQTILLVSLVLEGLRKKEYLGLTLRLTAVLFVFLAIRTFFEHNSKVAEVNYSQTFLDALVTFSATFAAFLFALHTEEKERLARDAEKQKEKTEAYINLMFALLVELKNVESDSHSSEILDTAILDSTAKEQTRIFSSRSIQRRLSNIRQKSRNIRELFAPQLFAETMGKWQNASQVEVQKFGKSLKEKIFEARIAIRDDVEEILVEMANILESKFTDPIRKKEVQEVIDRENARDEAMRGEDLEEENSPDE